MLLVKPDGFRSSKVRAHLEQLLAASGLEVRLRYDMKFSSEDVLDVWPKFGHTKHRFTRALLGLYMCSGP